MSTPRDPDMTDAQDRTCVPLCGASRAYANPEPWQHEALCPARKDPRARRLT